MFSWNENQLNNEAAFRRELGVRVEGEQGGTGRSLLGLQKPSAQGEYDIGKFMTLTFRDIVYAPHANPLRLLSAHHLRQLAFLAAVAYFTIATESRFSASDLSEMRGSMPIDQKYHKLNHDERLFRCKVLLSRLRCCTSRPWKWGDGCCPPATSSSAISPTPSPATTSS